MPRKLLVAGNWKMNGSYAANAELVTKVVADAALSPDVELLVCPPAIYLESVNARLGGKVALGGQNLSDQAEPGAFTGEIHGGMLKEAGCRYVLVGHSERRALYGEDDECVAQKFETAQRLGLIPILCVGETLPEREGGQTEAVVERQVAAVLRRSGVGAFANAVIAYEPVWAIGTGRVATSEQAQATHAFLRGLIAAQDANIAGSLRLLYGGSCKPENARVLFACADIDGGLIGGASLKASDFLAIAAAAQAAASAA